MLARNTISVHSNTLHCPGVHASSGALTHLLACSSSDLPNFFASTKFFACLDLLESKELFEATEMVQDATLCAQLLEQSCSDPCL